MINRILSGLVWSLIISSVFIIAMLLVWFMANEISLNIAHFKLIQIGLIFGFFAGLYTNSFEHWY